MQEILNTTKSKMDKAIETLRHNLVDIRTGRANPAILDRIEVDYYGSPTPINQMASIQVVEGRQLMIKPYDKSLVKDMETAINTSDIGFPVINDGDVLRINIPTLTEETRKSLSKDASKIGEESKIAIRNIRRDANDMAKKSKELTEDLKKDAQERIQKITDDYVKKIDDTVKEKIDEIMSI
ncbi:ribosome recycling factor [Breznakia sp. PF5-3]|uniref:ribosome recycling factor n=1 Tax=unclassified Breznakia TaxID=2623764 RepID=UPI002405B266|nr:MULTISPECIES: ribosome recycling factor [unclassified Breznakia]MDL2276153.1 ribosome recycling factor [Breznakia sp. OttesenSCG-928-G09]MDF9824399.1 ribosome recycling factor [Breznakia sp. PM6-1]MDF9835128.1 ribosome recycling factor [Breznakia sp. PF5-3]MDF9838223.1 ribosome recycling factor [Breznakia sp. PFB2-8]MDF9860238.1 ribosome recycling factor [Breznakia sp. PH5-24]